MMDPKADAQFPQVAFTEPDRDCTHSVEAHECNNARMPEVAVREGYEDKRYAVISEAP